MPQTPSSFPRQEPSSALNRRILPSVDCAFRAAPSGRYSDRRPRFPSESRLSRCFISAHPESCGHRIRIRTLKTLSSSPSRNLHRRSIAAFSLRSACASRCLSMNSFILLPPCGHRTGSRMPQTPSSFPRQEPSSALNRRCWPRFPSESRPSRCFISAHPESCGHRIRKRRLKRFPHPPAGTFTGVQPPHSSFGRPALPGALA